MSLLNSRRLMRVKRTTPRIISRSYGEKFRRTEGSSENLPSPNRGVQNAPPMPNDVEEELQSEIFMKGGMAVSVGTKFDSNSKIDDSMSMFACTQKPHSIADAENDELAQDKEIVELPGVANEVESYPCPICTMDKVFLTVNGLERHAHEEHPHALDMINASIARIQNEWNRRRTQGFVPNLQANIDEEVEYVSDKMVIGQSGYHSHQEACKICEAVVDISRPTAMEYHMQAHKKNNELRQYLLEVFGQRYVDIVTCKECAMVFENGRALAEHIQTFHKKRRYVCRWCGKIFNGMSQLNVHKMQVHNIQTHNNSSTTNYVIFESADVAIPSTSNAMINESVESDENPEPCELTRTIDDIHHTNDHLAETLYGANVDDSVPCKTKCQECSLVIMKPSLLLRHMLRVHNKHEFAAEVTSRFSVPLKFTILADGRVIWTCCNEDFDDRERVLQHRHLMHTVNMNMQIPATENENSVQSDNSDRTNLQKDGVPITSQEILLETEPILSMDDKLSNRDISARKRDDEQIDSEVIANDEMIFSS